MEIKVEKESVDYSFEFDEGEGDMDDILSKSGDLENAVYEMDEVLDIEGGENHLGVIIEGKHDTPETLEKIKKLIQEHLGG